MNPLSQAEGKILLWIQENLRNDFCSAILCFITITIVTILTWITICCIFTAIKKTRRAGITALASLISAFLINDLIIKNIVQRTRPFKCIEGLKALGELPRSTSFPSGHSASSFACAVVLFCLLPKKYGIPALVLAFIIAFSRLYVGVHFPTDVLCGSLTGTIVALTSVHISNRISERSCNKQ